MREIIDDLILRYPQLNYCNDSISEAFEVLKDAYENGHKLLVCGNGGSCSDAEHIVGELMKGFEKRRPLPAEISSFLLSEYPDDFESFEQNLDFGFPAIALGSQTALGTAIANDTSAEFLYAQQILGYGEEGDILMGISTSGNSMNIINAFKVAKSKKMKTILLSGKDGGRLVELADIAILAPASETFLIQELHLPIYHALCRMIEHYFYEDMK